VFPDGDCQRLLIDSEDGAKIILQGVLKHKPGARIIRVRLMSATRPPGKTNWKKPQPLTGWRLGRPVRPRNSHPHNDHQNH
jgi:hypothetical protein